MSFQIIKTYSYKAIELLIGVGLVALVFYELGNLLSAYLDDSCTFSRALLRRSTIKVCGNEIIPYMGYSLISGILLVYYFFYNFEFLPKIEKRQFSLKRKRVVNLRLWIKFLELYLIFCLVSFFFFLKLYSVFSNTVLFLSSVSLLFLIPFLLRVAKMKFVIEYGDKQNGKITAVNNSIKDKGRIGHSYYIISSNGVEFFVDILFMFSKPKYTVNEKVGLYLEKNFSLNDIEFPIIESVNTLYDSVKANEK
jgi:hypothetical protein